MKETLIDYLAHKAQDIANKNCLDEFGGVDERKRSAAFRQAFAELIVKECADAGDAAYDVRCDTIGDYIVNHFDLGAKEGAANWREKNEI